MLTRLLPRLSSDARALLAKERAIQVTDEALRRRVLERARAALEADRPSGVSLRLASESAAAPRARARLARSALLVAAVVAVAGLAAAGADLFERLTTPAPNAAHMAPPARSSLVRVAKTPPAPAVVETPNVLH